VVVGEDVAVLRDDHPRADTLLTPLAFLEALLSLLLAGLPEELEGALAAEEMVQGVAGKDDRIDLGGDDRHDGRHDLLGYIGKHASEGSQLIGGPRGGVLPGAEFNTLLGGTLRIGERIAGDPGDAYAKHEGNGEQSSMSHTHDSLLFAG
jgi:hypothetical protein